MNFTRWALHDHAMQVLDDIYQGHALQPRRRPSLWLQLALWPLALLRYALRSIGQDLVLGSPTTAFESRLSVTGEAELFDAFQLCIQREKLRLMQEVQGQQLQEEPYYHPLLGLTASYLAWRIAKDIVEAGRSQINMQGAQLERVAYFYRAPLLGGKLGSCLGNSQNHGSGRPFSWRPSVWRAS